MPSPKSGAAGTPVPPTDATAACDADVADPGAVEAEKSFQRETQTGKYGTVQVTPFKPTQNTTSDSNSTQSSNNSNTTTPQTSWIEIVLVDEDNKPIPGESYAITLPDSTVASGSLDENGFARVEGFDPGNCQVTFPNLDQDAWTQN